MRMKSTYVGCSLFFLLLFFVSVNVLIKEPIVKRTQVLEHCLNRKVTDLADLLSSRDRFWVKDRSECMDASASIDRIFGLEIDFGVLKVPDKMEPVVKDWLGQNEMLFLQFFNQTLIHVKNKWSYTTTMRNPLRSSKPKPKTKDSSLIFSQHVVNASRDSCHFCDKKFKDFTAEDSFGRINSIPGIHSSANAFRFSSYNAIFFPEEHSPFSISLKTFKGWFKAASNWFKLVHAGSQEHTHPMILWDAMPHGGASQVHPHMHGVLGKGEYLGKYLHMDHVAQNYAQATNGRHYLNDYVDAHVALGLGFRSGSAAVLSPLDAWKEHEFLIIGTEASDEWLELFYQVYRLFVEDFKVFCWSTGIVLPPMANLQSPLGAVARISSRGECQSVASDVSSLDLYTFFSINTNPIKSFEALKKRLTKTTQN